MSGTETIERVDQTAQDDTVEARARAIGWKDRHEFANGAPANWVDAEAFLRRGETEMPAMQRELANLRKEAARQRREAAEMRGVVATMSDSVRRAEERALARARRELQAERDKAIERGDKEGVRAVDAELETIKDPPKPATPAAPAAGTPPAMDPVVAAWVEENKSWFNPGNATVQREADYTLKMLENLHPDWSTEEQLAETKRRIEVAHPNLFENTRRRAAPAVSGSTAAPAAPIRRGRDFDSMPNDVKTQFSRYVKMLEGKGKPLTKDEWAENYWSQFPEQ